MINGIQFIIRSRKADLRIQGYLTKITFRLCYFIISLQLTAAVGWVNFRPKRS